MTIKDLLAFCKENNIKLALEYEGSASNFNISIRKEDFNVSSSLDYDLLHSTDAGLLIKRILNKMVENIDEELDNRQWISTKEKLPPQKQIVLTKIDDQYGKRNETRLYFHNHLWWLSDGSMYVYYRPTHWKPIYN